MAVDDSQLSRGEGDMAGDAVVVAPHFYKTVLENDHVRVLEFRGKPGDKTTMHSHPAMVYIGLTEGSFKFSAPDGQTMEVNLKAGEPLFLDPVDHATEVMGSAEVHGYLVELK
jgi:quercetin dioxygenase-like cupin family protein